MTDDRPSIGRGSLWRRWDPHIHAPGTVLNNQFKGSDVWEEYLSRIEAATPKVEVLGITDYWRLDLYEAVLAKKDEGRLPDVELIFPNIEIRFGIGTQKGALNAHLLISPEASDHLEQARRFLSKLTFRANEETYSCTPKDLIELGRAHDPDVTDERRALEVGTNQFKTTLEDLSGAIEKSKWAKENILIAIAASSSGGTSGLKGDASMAATRREIQRRADVIFSGNPEERAFWLGEKSDTLEQLREKYDGAKPCLHGSDAHKLDLVCAPDQERYTWIKGDATFEALRQALIEPGTRVLVDKAPPEGALPYRVISSIELKGASWCSPAQIELNPRLVGIIGARGSGKTALADLIATGAGSPEGRLNERSFISRAADHLADLEIVLDMGRRRDLGGGRWPGDPRIGR